MDRTRLAVLIASVAGCGGGSSADAPDSGAPAIDASVPSIDAGPCAEVTTCTDSDGCCPSGCNANSDNDCAPECGNDVQEMGETCDPLSSCPTSCDDGDACTADVLIGDPAACTSQCSFTDIDACTSGDGCCPAGCSFASDTDCVNGLTLKLTSNRSCDEEVLTQVDDVFTYTFDVVNTGLVPPAERSINVDGLGTDRVLAELKLDARTELIPGQTIIASPAGAVFVVQRSADVGGDLWTTYGAWNGVDELDAIGLLVEAEDLEVLESAVVVVIVEVRDDVVPADDSSVAGPISPRLRVDIDGDNTPEFESAEACNTLDVLEPNLTLLMDGNQSGDAGATVIFEHSLQNSGDLADSYDIALAQVAGGDDGDFDSIAVFYAADGDGQFDDVLTTTPTIQPGQSLLMRVETAVPGGAIAGESYGLTLTATSTGGSFGSVLSASNTDTVTVP